MNILESASVKDRKHLLELFPITNLRASWPSVNGTKDDLCYSVAEKQPINEIVGFIDEHLSCCKQHVYIFSRSEGPVTLPPLIVGGEKVHEVAGDHALYIIRTAYDVTLKDPLEDASLEFLWPVRVEITGGYVIIRFVVLEKNLSSYFDRSYYVGGRSIDEKTVLKLLKNTLSLEPADLHKGVKKLWAEDFMDSTRAEYKKPISMARESMDEDRGIKEHNPELYGVLQDSPLFNTVFTLSKKNKRSVSAFVVDPSRGYIAFLRYSETSGDTDFVIRAIIKSN